MVEGFGCIPVAGLARRTPFRQPSLNPMEALGGYGREQVGCLGVACSYVFCPTMVEAVNVP